MSTEKPPHNIALASLWFGLSLLVAAAAIAVVFSQTPLLMPGLLLLSVVLFMTGRQRVQPLAIDPQKYHQRVRVVALLSAVFCGAAVALNSVYAALV
ncbi:hypothetical protein [Rheinheimera sp. 1928-s]|uniref:hypothetical protein n=1 Tax=Rheinheimera sp. 1928-s TaxID=3033803 RepID=UPI002632C78B|nr:hypothetical protein [Rheinheimera sp. 1928-s]MDF3126467.1 hypothetical protein [Rheinheimera sp. 1928-s]